MVYHQRQTSLKREARTPIFYAPSAHQSPQTRVLACTSPREIERVLKLENISPLKYLSSPTDPSPLYTLDQRSKFG
jgi:hypothetical protein